MNILITGGAGFIGTHLTRHLLGLGHAITVIDNFSVQIHAGRIKLAPDLVPYVHLIRGDAADPAVLVQGLETAECLVHLAAETGTGQSMYEVTRYDRTNIGSTALIYDLVSKSKAPKLERVVVASSRAIYGEGAYQCLEHGLVYPVSRTSAEKKSGLFDPLCPACQKPCISVPTPESAPLQPSSFYGLTKQVQEQTVLLFGSVLGIPSFGLRYQNVYGPGQSLHNPYTGILAIFSNLARSGELIRVFEDGEESRDFVYVNDVVSATVACLNSMITGCHAVNVGSNERTTVMTVASEINAFFGGRSGVQITGAFREGDIRHGLADLSRVRGLLGYEPQWEFRPGLRTFLEWASENELPQNQYERSLAEMKHRGLLQG